MRGDSESADVGDSVREPLARATPITLRTGSPEDGGDGQKGGDQELSTEEHREREQGGLGVGSVGVGSEEAAVRK